MKKQLLTLILLIITFTAMTQTKPKTKEKAPSQNEMQDMLKEMQKAMDEISPEDKKAMEEMGIKMPDVKNIQKNISGITDAQLKQAYDKENRIVPKKDGTGT